MAKKEANMNLRLPKGMKEKIEKIALKKDKSYNTIANRAISGGLSNSKLYFEMQHLDKGEKFSFREDFEEDQKNCKIYRFTNVDPSNGDYLCTSVTEKGIFKRFEHKVVFYKQIFTH